MAVPGVAEVTLGIYSLTIESLLMNCYFYFEDLITFSSDS